MAGGSIFLVGMMGSGKTTVGRALAQRLHLPFIDTDKILVERTGVPVTTIFEIEGEAGFRRRESAVIAELAHAPDQVVATGGGAVLSADNRALMRSAGRVIYLERLGSDTYAYIELDGGEAVTVRLTGTAAIATGEAVRLAMTGQVHRFHADGGLLPPA